jgi:hypothetical protein
VREVRTGRVDMRGLVDDDELEHDLDEAHIGLVTQRPDVVEFNVPSRLMTLLARGIPVLAVTRRDSEVRRLLEASGDGWIVDEIVPGGSPRFSRTSPVPLMRSHGNLRSPRPSLRRIFAGGRGGSIRRAPRVSCRARCASGQPESLTCSQPSLPER